MIVKVEKVIFIIPPQKYKYTITCTSSEVHGVQGSERFLFCTHWLNPLDVVLVLPVSFSASLSSVSGGPFPGNCIICRQLNKMYVIDKYVLYLIKLLEFLLVLPSARNNSKMHAYILYSGFKLQFKFKPL